MANHPSAAELKGRVASAVLRDGLAYWSGFLQRGIVPFFDDVERWHIKPALPYIWIWCREAEIVRFVCPGCGEHVNDIFGRNISGKAVDEVMPAVIAAEAQARYLIGTRVAHQLVGSVYHFSDQQVMGERGILPLAPARKDGGGVLGATDAAQSTLRLNSPVDPMKFVGIGAGERRDYDVHPDRRHD